MNRIKRRILLITFAVIVLTILCIPNKSLAQSRADRGEDKIAHETFSVSGLSVGSKITIGLTEMTHKDNVYCIQYHQDFGDDIPFTVKNIIKIKGAHSEGTAFGGARDNDCNRVLAAILGGQKLAKGFGWVSKGVYDCNSAQIALYSYWNTWVKNVGKYYGFSEETANDSYQQGQDTKYNQTSSTYVDMAKVDSYQTDYEITIYSFTVGTSGNQEIIIVDVGTPTNIEQPEPTTVIGYINISGYVWEDVANSKSNSINSQYEEGDIRLQGIKVYWKDSNGNVLASTETGSDGSYKFQTTIELYNHPYSIKDKTKYDQINNSYIEFSYNGLKYTTVAYNGTLSNANTSKGKEIQDGRTLLDNKFDKVENRAVYDGNTAIISGLPNTQISDANYASSIAVSASTKNIVSSLLKTTETNNWTQKKTFCAGHSKLEDGYGSTYYAADEIDGPTSGYCKSSVQGIYVWNIQNMNLGLVKREQPDAAITSDIEKVRVVMQNQEYTYKYGNRGIQNNEELFDYTVKFGNKYMETYSRPVNPSDIAYVNYNNTDDLKVYVTYNIILKNQSTTLPMTINSIVNYYDSNYTIYTGQGTSTTSGWQESNGTNNGYKIAYNTSLSGTKLQPGTKSEIIKIEFEVNQDRIKGLLNEDATLYNVSEIFSFTTYYGENTICAERETAATKGKTGQQYAGLDLDSTPGNAIPGNLDTYEDDTDKAPSFLLQKAPNYKTVSGTVYEDKQTEESNNNQERLGNGQKDENEKGIANVKVELLDASTGQPAYLYYKDSTGSGVNGANKKPAVTYTDENGNYSFGEPEEAGIIIGNYFIKYTYGDSDKDGDEATTEKTTIDGNTFINARNYKSTIITDEIVKGVMQGTNTSTQWYLDMDSSVDKSIAVDDLKERLTIESLRYENYYNSTLDMSAYSKPFEVKIEYTKTQEANVDAGGGNLATDWSTFDVGIIERPRENIVLNKTISKIKVTLANGQVLIEGDPRTESINYVKALGITRKTDSNGREIAEFSPLGKFLTIEMDSELIQGAKIEIWYSIIATNNSEIDYEYEKDYADIDNLTATNRLNFITSDAQANYYYYGNKNGLSPITQSVELVVDYMNPKLTCNVGSDFTASANMGDVNNDEWFRYDGTTPIDADYLKDIYICNETYDAIKDRELQAIATKAFENLAPAGGTKTSVLYATGLLSNQDDELVYDNSVEIIQLNGKIARTISSVTDTGEQVSKSYQPGSYIPSLDGALQPLQQDEDTVRIVVTPPTGVTNYTTIYIIAAVVGLIVMVGGIFLIKKKVIKK